MRTAIELGGQDAKVIFFHKDSQTGEPAVSDMRMNGSCAGGTGAFIDEIAALLDVEPEEFERMAERGRTVYDISGRCGVFAKTDIQPLLIQGTPREDIALSTYHAIAKQTIGGLSQGLELAPPIVFGGGPLTFHPTLVRVFAERLGLKDDEIVRPEHPETIVAYGAALSIDRLSSHPIKTKETTISNNISEYYDNNSKKAENIIENNDICSEINENISAENMTASAENIQEENCSSTIGLAGKDFTEEGYITFRDLYDRLTHADAYSDNQCKHAAPLFANAAQREAFERRHDAEALPLAAPSPQDGVLRVYMGIDSGSTTSKIALMDENEQMVDWYYDNNHGEPLKVIREGILHLYEKYERQGIRLEIIGLGTTGYGEQLAARAFGADYHIVETVAHSQACLKYFPDATFLLDIGGQDMKAIWMDDGIITNIMLNEACSSGCGSFLENFAATLNIPVDQIAEAAFSSSQPASLGSRCTVFMNSTIINEQREGRQPNDIMAGLCRSIIENVFTKVVRISNTADLGDRIVVQGGTFRNRAVLRALEEYLGKEVTLAPYPGEMGAFGAALLAKRELEERNASNIKENQQNCNHKSSFIGIEAVRRFSYTTETGVRCPLCANHCSRTIMQFSTGGSWVTGNRCERGAVVSDNSLSNTGKAAAFNNNATSDSLSDTSGTTPTSNARPNAHNNSIKNNTMTNTARESLSNHALDLSTMQSVNKSAPDLFLEREQMLFADYPYTLVVTDDSRQSTGSTNSNKASRTAMTQPLTDTSSHSTVATPHTGETSRGIVGLPRVLEFWDSMPFWSTFFRALGYTVKFSHKSSQKLYEDGLTFVASDTICFPAKLAHGHVQDLAQQGVDRIFMPYVMHMPPEGKDKLSPYVCSVVQGYPMVVRNAQSPEERYGVVFDTPIFHFFQEKDRRPQICRYATETLGVTKKQAREAYDQAEAAIKSFRSSLTERAAQIMKEASENGTFAVVLAGRPYHNDAFVSHGISQIFAKKGVPVLTADSLPGLNEVDLSNTRIEITNNFHTRMLSAAVLAAQKEELEYVQLVSFGCGHDAVLSDEIIRIMNEIAKKPPLILKIDESDASGSLGIRIQSFVETIKIRRNHQSNRTFISDRQNSVYSTNCSANTDNICNPSSQSDASGNPQVALKALTQNTASNNTETHVQSTMNNGMGTHTQNAVSNNVDSSIQNTVNNMQTPGNPIRPLPAPSPVKFYKADKKKRTLLVPNISAEVSVLLDTILEKEGFTVKTIPIGSTEQIRLGKQYVHNDICFPCQMVIGELISELKTGNYKQDEVAVAMVKFQCDCRMSHYAGLLRKGLDAAGFTEVPVATTDVNDTKKMHPGVFLLGISAVLEAVWGFMMLDIVMEQCRKIRPYETNPGQTDQICQDCVQRIADGIRSGIGTARKEFAKCIDDICKIPYDRSHLKPLVFVTGELLVTYHPGPNFHIERYLEQNGMETAFPRVMDQLRKDFQASMSEISQYHANIPPYPFAVDFLFNSVQKDLEKTARKHPLFVPGVSPRKLYEGVSDIIPETLSCGEGWLMAAEIAHYAENGAKTFIILQPFGCLPNHICGRGVIRKLKDRYPDIQILPLDLDPDTSYANVENRLQMLLMNTIGQGD